MVCNVHAQGLKMTDVVFMHWRQDLQLRQPGSRTRLGRKRF